eukprot:scaffold1743_cov77-Skeletonema_dohrnii-CCMP3373.AAC.1
MTFASVVLIITADRRQTFEHFWHNYAMGGKPYACSPPGTGGRRIEIYHVDVIRINATPDVQISGATKRSN